MAKRIHTFKVDAEIPVTSVPEDVSLEMKAAPGGNALLEIKATSAAYPLDGESVASIGYDLSGRVETRSLPLLDMEGLKVTSTKIEMQRVSKVRTHKVDISSPGTTETHAIDCRPPQDVKVSSSNYLEHMPITREALDLKLVPYKDITEFVMMLAEKNGMKYTNVQLIGIFDPVPVHLATGLVLDSARGVLKYKIRKDPVDTGGRRIMRVIYGRNRTTDEIISATAPVT